jgi:LCP family protein required for cell wall assembly
MRKKSLFIIIPLLIILGTAFGAFYYVNSRIYTPTPIKNIFETKEEKEKAQFIEEKGITNILLIGVDGRENDKDARTDSIILATVDSNNKRIKLTSFMRDMYVPIPGHGQNKINSAYFFGGPELLIKTINQAFDLNVQYYMSIDFRAFQDLVDKLGGIDLEVKDYEVDEINYYIKEANWHNPIYIKGPGYQHLNGQQALSYSRIRKVGNNDYERTERQRKVLSLLIEKARKTSFLRLPELFSAIIPYVKTNIPATKLMNLGYTAYKFGNTPVESLRIPADGMFEDMKINGASVLVPDLERNTALLDRFMFSTGGIVANNLPVYMENNFHADDKPIDKRGVLKKPKVKIVIPKEVIENPDEQSPDEGVNNNKKDADQNQQEVNVSSDEGNELTTDSQNGENGTPNNNDSQGKNNQEQDNSNGNADEQATEEVTSGEGNVTTP